VDAQDEKPGALFNRYRLVCPLARGGMGAVWLARLDGAFGMEKLVALKMILPDSAADPRFRNMFLDEARLAARISHPNVAAVLEIGESDGNLFYAMDWVDGEPLRTLQRACAAAGDTVPVGIAARIIADACLGLHAAHELHGSDGAPLEVVHRDVSPQNILVTEDGIPRIIDFGIAKARARLSEETREGILKGKMEYIAPEQAAGTSVDRRTDVWGAGAVLYHLVAGRPVFDREDKVAVATALLTSMQPDPLPETIPAPMAAVIRRAVTPARELRYATALEMAQALDGAMRESGIYTTQAEVASFVAIRLAEKREARRATIGRALAATRSVPCEALPEADLAALTPSVSLEGNVATPPARPRARAKTTVALATLAIAVLTTLLIVLARRAPPDEPPPRAQATLPAPTPSPEPAPPPTPAEVATTPAPSTTPLPAADDASAAAPVKRRPPSPPRPVASPPPPPRPSATSPNPFDLR
jgi:serine/threonine protein kinase